VSESQQPRGLSLPSLWQWLVLGAVICAAWVLWSETRHRRLIPGAALLPDNPTERLQLIDALVRDGDASVPLFLTMLVDPNPKTRRDALLGLGRMHSPSVALRDAVRARLNDDDAHVRVYAFSAYKQMCRDELELRELAVRLLADPDGSVRDDARNMLDRAGPEVIPAIIAALGNDSSLVRGEAIGILQRHRSRLDEQLHTLIPAVRPLLSDPDPQVRRAAIEAICAWEGARPKDAREWLRDSDPQIVSRGLGVIDWHGLDAAGSFPDLFRLLKDADGSRLRRLLPPLKTLTLSGGGAVPLLLAKINFPDDLPRRFAYERPLRVEIIETLAEIGAPADELIPLLEPYLADVSQGTWAREILAQVSPTEARRQVSALISQLDIEEPATIKSALGSLWGFRTQAREAVPVLTRLLLNPDEEISKRATSLLVAVSPEDSAPAVPILLARMERERLKPWGPYPPSLNELAALGPIAKDAVPVLLKYLDASPSDLSDMKSNRGLNWLRVHVILALGQIGCRDPDVLSLLRSLVRADSWRDRATAAEALASPGVLTESVLPDLVDLLRDENSYVRGNAILAIGDLPGDRTVAVEPLIAALNDDDVYVQTAAAIALGQIGVPAAPAVAALREAAREPMNAFSNFRRPKMPSSWDLRDDRFHKRRSVEQAARWALAQIEPQANEEWP
jgi:HEAT repeat protein